MQSMDTKTPSTGTDVPNTADAGIWRQVEATLLARPRWVMFAVLLALALLPPAVWLDLRQIAKESLTRQARDLNFMVSGIRSYYSSNVVSRILQNHGQTTLTHNYADVAGGIPIPATLSIELAQVIGQRGDGLNYRFVSDYVFNGRAEHNLDEFEEQALGKLRQSARVGDSVTQISGSLFNSQIRMAVPVVMETGCVSCHNSHHDSPKKDWKVGDVRGIQSITLDKPMASNILSFKYLLTYLAIAGSVGLAFAVLQWRHAVRFMRMNKDLEETNLFLASVSMKISKYLSPQVYKSIFSGERDAIIATERKKLTIFFSDIMEFTQTTERLQPEELTALLNEYFTEMSTIAHQHGATVDKFIGDAILAFFGDPETKGTQEDAMACVEMAVAMQKRLLELNLEWRRRGIERPFRARIGINTGYCNVGNFGSSDRMDYTIIGADANLAARLESIAEPGGIVISYETYALVRNNVQARQLPPITLKGISREIVPYAIDALRNENLGSNRDKIETETNRLQLKLDLADMDREEAAMVEAQLQEALDRVRQQSFS